MNLYTNKGGGVTMKGINSKNITMEKYFYSALS